MKDKEDCNGIFIREKKLFGLIGMRVAKTVLAVAITFLYGYFRDINPIYASFAAVIVMKDNPKSTHNHGFGRMWGTVIGGLFGLVTLLILVKLGFELFSLPYYFIIALMLAPVIYVSVGLFGPESTIASCVVFLSITISHGGEGLPLQFAIMRTTTTAFGVAVAMLINRFI